jgi:hypothetical protein
VTLFSGESNRWYSLTQYNAIALLYSFDKEAIALFFEIGKIKLPKQLREKASSLKRGASLDDEQPCPLWVKWVKKPGKLVQN